MKMGRSISHDIVFLDTGTARNKKYSSAFISQFFMFRISWTREKIPNYVIQSFGVTAKDLASYVLILTPDILPSNIQT